MNAQVVSFHPVRFAALPGWEDDDHLAALAAFQKAAASGTRPQTPPSPGLLNACREAQSLDPLATGAARAFFESRFIPHRVIHDQPQGLLTGYYEPVLHGSRKREDAFQYPIYRRPPELENLVDETIRGTTGRSFTHGRRTANGLEPYFTRAEIESGALHGRALELVYLSDAVDAFFMHVQGSGRIKLSDGSAIGIAYDGKNGQPYTSIGRYLIDTGQLTAEAMSLQVLGDWLRAESVRGREVMWHNASFVFFRELKEAEADQPVGAMTIPLTSGRSLAVDAGIHAIGTPIYVAAPSLERALTAGPFQRLMIAQDVGSAITGSGDAAGQLAGVTKHPGNFFVLLPREGSQ